MFKRTLSFIALACLPSLALASFAGLSTAERSYYEKVFAYSMETTKPDDTYDWSSYSGNGRIRVGETFTSKSGATCRNFSEAFTIKNVEGQDYGVGCKRNGSNGWCKLRSNNALTCAMERPADFFNVRVPNVNATVPGINVGKVGAPGVKAPSSNPNMPNAPQVDAPQTGKVDGTGVADTVTGAAGSVAGPATSKMLNWFDSAFR